VADHPPGGDVLRIPGDFPAFHRMSLPAAQLGRNTHFIQTLMTGALNLRKLSAFSAMGDEAVVEVAMVVIDRAAT
jgi:hypothetical protein